jgi:hypoxanthine phosphoribosyltransferase
LSVVSMIQLKDKYFKPLIDQQTLERRIAEMAQQISQAYAHKNPIFVGILNGSFMFAAELMKHIQPQAEITFLRVASYQATHSTGQVKELLGLTESLAGRHVVVLEDIVDTGITLHQVWPQLLAHKPASLALATMLFKPKSLQKPLDIKYIGFEIEPLFVIGYGLDYDGLGRNIPEIYVLAE